MTHGSYTQQVRYQSKAEQNELEGLKERCTVNVSPDTHYIRMKQVGLEYGPSFQTICEILQGDNESLVHISLKDTLEDDANEYEFHPVLLDACFQAMATLSTTDENEMERMYIPAGLESLSIYQKPGTECWCHVKRNQSYEEDRLVGDIRVFHMNGTLAAEIRSFTVQRIDSNFVEHHCIQHFSYETDWQLIDYNPRDMHASLADGAWVIFADQQGVGAALANRIKEHGGKAYVVFPGDCFSKLAEDIYNLNPQEGQQIEQLFHVISEIEQATISTIAFLWNLNFKEEILSAKALVESQVFIQSSLLALSRKLIQHSFVKSSRLWLITSGAQEVEGETAISLAQAPVWGFGRTFSGAYPKQWGGLIDIDPDGLNEDNAQFILNEIAVHSDENQIAYRKGVRYAARLERSRSMENEPVNSYRYRSDCSYLITGGLGDLGLQVAKRMAEKGAVHLILMGRTQLPERLEWRYVPKESSIGKKINAIEEIESFGANVYLASVDITDEKQLSDFIHSYQKNGIPAIGGIIHAAGVVKNQSIEQIELQDMMEILKPKIVGSWLLHNYFNEDTLDFFILFSSMTSLISPPRLASYASGNAFLDALARERKLKGLSGLSINWGPWGETGMAVRDTLSNKANRSNQTAGMMNLEIEEGLNAFELVKRSNKKQLAIANIDWKYLQKMFPDATNIPFLEHVIEKNKNDYVHNQKEKDEELRSALKEAGQEDRRGILETYLLNLISDVMKIKLSKYNLNQSLYDIGLDSMMAAELKNRVEQEIGVSIQMVTILKEGTISAIIQEIEQGFDKEASLHDSPTTYEVLNEYPLSHGQRAIWFLQQISPLNTAYNVGFAVKIKSGLNIEVLKKSFEKVIERHPSLRINVKLKNGEPVQIIQDRPHVEITILDATVITEASLKEKMKNDLQRPFSLEVDAMVRLFLYQQDDADILMIAVHHIAIDFWGIEVLLDDLRQIYKAKVQGEVKSLAPLKSSYADFVYWQSEMLTSQKGERHLAYWKKQLSGELTELDLPADYSRPKVQTFNGASLFFEVNDQLTGKLKEFVKQEGTTLFTVLLAVFQIMLHRYTGQERVIVGSPTTGRSKAEFENIVGDFINMLPLKSNISSNPSFRTYIKEVQATVLQALEHQDYPFGLMVEKLHPDRDPARSPIFQASFILQKLHRYHELAPFMVHGKTEVKSNFGGMEIEPYYIPQQEGQLDITLEMGEANGILFGALKYNTHLFEKATMERMTKHFKTLLENVVKSPDQPVKQINMLFPTEAHKLFIEWNDTKKDFNTCACLHELIDEQAEKTPNKTAVVFENKQLSYHELKQRSNQLANYLKQWGVQQDVKVGICVERSIEMVIGLIGILKAGAAYVPMDPAFPKDRLYWMLEDTKAPVILTQNRNKELFTNHDAQIICLDSNWDEISQESVFFNSGQSKQENLAYVIYTSGSTGKPKGVQITHEAVVNILKSMAISPGIAENDALLAVTTLSFDISVLEIFLPLIAGAKTVILRREDAMDGDKLKNRLYEIKPNIMQATPATWRLLLETDWKGDPNLKLLCGGEALTKDLSKKLLEKCGSLWNLYGPTEATVWMTVKQMTKNDTNITIGNPIHNMEAYILDSYQNPVPIGISGELYIGGTGLAKGYLNRPDLNREKFVSLTLDGKKKRLYRTGDLARFQSNGEIEYLGRIDNQVKVNGYRIELGEIETILNWQSAIEQAVVMTVKSAIGKQLAAYIVVYSKENVTVEKLRSYLKEKLPDYMIPSTYIIIDKMPLTPNGKVDRKALSQLSGKRIELDTDYVPPQNEVEKMLTDLWCEVLSIEKPGVNDNFFDLGGTSLLTAKVHHQLKETFSKDFSVVELFKYPTIRTLSEFLTNERTDDSSFRQEKLSVGKSRTIQLRNQRRRVK